VGGGTPIELNTLFQDIGDERSYCLLVYRMGEGEGEGEGGEDPVVHVPLNSRFEIVRVW
jgi:hypothetical protein